MPHMLVARIGVVAFAIFSSMGIAQAPPQIVLSVIVTDQTGAVIPKAGIRATDEGTGTARDVAADANGRTDIGLPAGTYTLRVQSPGFKTWVEKSVEIKESMRKTVALRIGSYDGPVVVIPDYPGIQVDWQSLDTTIAPIPLVLLDLPAKPLHHRFHLGATHS
jgi:Carboxypeptidase regulatory-like domain